MSRAPMNHAEVRELPFGQRVNVTQKYVRSWRTQERYGTWKFWKSVPCEVTGGVFLGIRSLQNGVCDYDHDYGHFFVCHERIVAALVAPSRNVNPIYVPIEALELVLEIDAEQS